MKPDAAFDSREREEAREDFPRESLLGEADSSRVRCFLCGEASSSELECCPSCGAIACRKDENALHPLFESRARVETESCRQRSVLGVGLRRLAWAGETAFALAWRPDGSFRDFAYWGGLWAPVFFAILLGGSSLVVSLAEGSILAGEGPNFKAGWIVLAFLLAPPIYAYLRAHLLHLSLVLSGRSRAPFTTTFRIVSYSNASIAPLLMIPYVGDALFLVWGAVVEATGLRHGHRLTLQEAALTELTPSVVLLIGMCGAAAVGFLSWSQAAG